MKLTREEAFNQGYTYEILNSEECKIIKFRSFKNKIKKLEVPQYIEDKLVVAIGENVFTAQGIQEIILHNGLFEIEARAFSHNKIKTLTLPDTVISVHEEAFSANPNIKLTVPNNCCLPILLDRLYEVNSKESNFNLCGFLDTRASKHIFLQEFRQRVFFKLTDNKTYVARASIVVALTAHSAPYQTTIYTSTKDGLLVNTNREAEALHLARKIVKQILDSNMLENSSVNNPPRVTH